MRRDYPSLMQDLGLTSSTCISRSQLIRILDRFDYRAFNRLNMHYFSKQINKNGLEWYAIDGKELRGSIDTQAGEKPGENVVFSVNHSHYQSEILGYYLGKKESEKTTVKRYFQDKIDLSGKAFSFDALHNSSILLEEIASKGGVYLAQIKKNQSILWDDLEAIRTCNHHFYQNQTIEKGHGRIETRKAYCYYISPDDVDDRWNKADITSFIYLERERVQVKTGKISNEAVYFISNLPAIPKNGSVLFKAVRRHWRVEINNNIRDSNFGEDKIISRKNALQRSIAAFLNVAINRLQTINHQNNLNELREEICEDRRLIHQLF